MRNRNNRAFLTCMLTTMLLVSCDNKRVYDEYASIGKNWSKDTSLSFKFQQPDTIHKYDLFINVRNTNEYQFSNLFLIVQMNFPDGNVISDTLEYDMAAPNGEWLGTGVATKESKLWYKENVRFPEEGTYEVNIEQAMRKMNEPNGVQSLQGISEVGFRIEKK